MERQIPKNVRQIGNVSGSPKIYVEDYVDTFLGQLCEKAGENPKGAFLIGDIQHTEEEEYIYIYGAVQMHELKIDDNGFVLDEPTWKQAYEDCKQYFEGGEMLGWFAAHAGGPLIPDAETVKLHRKSFPKENTIFIMKDAVEKDEAFYVHKFNDLLEVSGHYTYYEKNPNMQNYMISCRKKNGVCSSETVEDRAAKDFRSLVRAREERQRQKKASRMMYAMSAGLVLVVLIMGVVMMNNFDKMRSMQDTLQAFSSSADIGEGQDIGLENAKDKQGNLDTEDGQAQEPTDSGEGTLAMAETDEAQNNEGQTDDLAAEQIDMNTESQGGEKEASADLWNRETVETSGNITNPAGEGDENGNDGIYVVEDGDTLAIISKKMYGDISHVDAICRMNGLTDGNLIYIGQKLLLP